METQRVMDILTPDLSRVLTPQEVVDGWILPQADATGTWIKMNSVTYVKVSALAKQWQNDINSVPDYLIRAATSATSRLMGAGIDPKAARIIKAWGWRGGGLGLNEQGRVDLVEIAAAATVGMKQGRSQGQRDAGKQSIQACETTRGTVYAAGTGILKVCGLDPLGHPRVTAKRI